MTDKTAPSFLRYILTGLFNTAFGYGLFAGINFLLADKFKYSYILASVLSNILAITFAYVNYKLFVFRTSGSYLREYLRFYLVYGFSFALGLVLLPIFVEILGISPYISGALLLPISVLISFLGHRNFSFAQKR